MSEQLRDDVRRAIVRPVVSEKSYMLVQAHNQYTFRVLEDAHKIEIRQAVEELFDVTVTDVRTIAVKAKPNRWPQQQWAHHDPPHRWRSQAPVPHHRLQTHEGRHSGQGRCD